ncbi:MAG TPA: prolyl oligopeptidase family serine peptidase [Longimicrobiales bacterium]|nr:prolyl oligopeptidase family serine peptidase [Longimicrobiales bacterium]
MIQRMFQYGALAMLAVVPTVGNAQTLKYPATKKVDVAEDYHGTRVADPFRWLEDQNGAETAAWVQAENDVTFPYLSRLPERDKIKKRMTELWNYSRYSTPFREGGQYFFYLNTGLQNQSVLYVQKTLKDSARVLLDPNLLSSDGTVALSQLSISQNGRLLGYGTATSGSDWNEFHVRDIASGRDLPDTVRWVKFSDYTFTKDGRGFFYSRFPEPNESEKLKAALANHMVYYHTIGTPQSQDKLIYSDPAHPTRFMRAVITQDYRYAVIYIQENTDPKNRLYYIDLKNPDAPDLSAPLVKLIDDNRYGYNVVGNDGPILYVVTNEGAPRQKLIAIDTRDPVEPRTIIPQANEVLVGVNMVGGRFFARYLQDAHSVVRIFALDGKPMGELQLPTVGSVGSMSGKKDNSELFYSFTSFLYPTTIFRYDITAGKSEVFRRPDVGFDANAYETKQIFYSSKDGTRVPMFITHKKGMPLNGQNPTYLYGYGGFDISMVPSFSVPIIVWLEMGGVYAMPNLRGGGEYGAAWHEAGTKERKQNVFDDFISAGEYLIKQGYTSPGKLAIGGGSNGGLLVGAAMTQRPELFAVAFPQVGVLDMLRYHKFTIGSAWVGDYGSADNAADFQYLIKYSPLHNIKPGVCYPATMIATADHDDRVVPGHSFKFAATLQPAQGCDKPVLIRIETKAGHGAGTPISKTIEQFADFWAFARHNMGIRALVP